MKKNIKKAMAAVAAMSIVACTAAVSASAADVSATGEELVKIKVQDRHFDTVEDYLAADMDGDNSNGVQLTVNIDMEKNAGVTAYEFGVKVAEPLTYVDNIESDDITVPRLSPSSADTRPNGAGETTSWYTWGASAPNTKTGVIMQIIVTCPADAKAGDSWPVEYREEGTKLNIFQDVVTQPHADYVADGTFTGLGGIIDIAEEMTEPPTDEPTPEPVTETPPTETMPITDEPTSGPATSAPGTKPATSAPATSSTSSPATGTTDVLPIVGVAAAVAVLGGVAIVSKKKND